MYNVIIFGTGQTSRVVMSGLNKSVNVIAYCDNNEEKWNTCLSGKMIIEPDNINKYKYDCIIIASQFNDEIYDQLLRLGVSRNKIFQFFKYINLDWNYVEHKIDDINDDKKIEGIVTGISYLAKAISTSYFEKRFYNLAHASQDLYYDYNLIKYFMEDGRNYLPEIKYCIIGLCYYSFQYDMSLSSMKTRVPLYYKCIGKKHNLKDIDSYMNDYSINNILSKKIFKYDENGYMILNWFQNEKHIYKLDTNKGESQAKLDSSKNYPNTVEENKKIFDDYLNLLSDNGVKAIVVICPLTKYYYKFFSERIKSEFYNIVEEKKMKYNFQFLDYSESQLFNDDDFFDVSHLNNQGAIKFTKILNNEIEW